MHPITGTLAYLLVSLLWLDALNNGSVKKDFLRRTSRSIKLASNTAKVGGKRGTGTAGEPVTDKAKVFFISPAVGEASKFPPSVVVKRATP